jgi:signal peptidase I
MTGLSAQKSAALKKILIIASIVLSLGMVIIVSSALFLIRAVRVPTGSMANTIIPGDHLIVIKWVGEVERGDVVVFRYPNDPSVLFVGRVIGLPAETIEIRDRSVFVNGKELPEQRVTVKPELESPFPVLEELGSEGAGPYKVFYWPRNDATRSNLEAGYADAKFGTTVPLLIPDNQYFFLGDNRDNSYDSRFYGTVGRNQIVGDATVIYWSADGDKIRWERISSRIK